MQPLNVLTVSFRDWIRRLAVGHLGVTHIIFAVEQEKGHILLSLMIFFLSSGAGSPKALHIIDGWVLVQPSAPTNLHLLDGLSGASALAKASLTSGVFPGLSWLGLFVLSEALFLVSFVFGPCSATWLLPCSASPSVSDL
jgi:hypothetical protein